MWYKIRFIYIQPLHQSSICTPSTLLMEHKNKYSSRYNISCTKSKERLPYQNFHPCEKIQSHRYCPWSHNQYSSPCRCIVVVSGWMWMPHLLQIKKMVRKFHLYEKISRRYCVLELDSHHQSSSPSACT